MRKGHKKNYEAIFNFRLTPKQMDIIFKLFEKKDITIGQPNKKSDKV